MVIQFIGAPGKHRPPASSNQISRVSLQTWLVTKKLTNLRMNRAQISFIDDL